MRKIPIYTIFLIPLVAFAESPKDSNRLARELVQLLRYETQMEAYRDQCMKMAKTVPPESLIKETPEKFGGITPKSPYWPRVVSAYEQYYKELCAKPTASEFLDAMAKVYAERLSIKELKSAVNFYSSASGKKLVDAHKMVAADIYALVGKANAAEVPKAMANFDHRLIEINKEAQSARKCPNNQVKDDISPKSTGTVAAAGTINRKSCGT